MDRCTPTFLEEVEMETPSIPSVYTDGGVHHPTTSWLSMARFGVWIPGEDGSDDLTEDDEPTPGLIAHRFKNSHGEKLWSRIAGANMHIHACRDRRRDHCSHAEAG